MAEQVHHADGDETAIIGVDFEVQPNAHGRHQHDNVAQDVMVNRVPSLEAAFLNPLMIEHVLKNIFNRLQNSVDLISCFNVCKTWAEIADPYYVKLTGPVILSGELTDPNSVRYLKELEKFPGLLSYTNFRFCCVKLNSPIVKNLLEKIGKNIKSLTLDYSANQARQIFNNDEHIITVEDVQNLLFNQLPNLEFLNLVDLPGSILQNIKFSGRQDLKLKKIAYNSHLKIGCFPLLHFVPRLYSICPNLEELDMLNVDGYYGLTLWPLIEINPPRIQQIKKLGLLYVRQGEIEFLNTNLGNAQLEEFKFRMLDIYWPSLEIFLNKQRASLKSIRLPFAKEGVNIEYQLMPMPNLKKLELVTLNAPRRFPTVTTEATRRTKIDFGFHEGPFKFPNLEVLKLKGDTRWLVMDSIFPAENENAGSVPSLRVIKDLPIGVDQVLMKRIGKLFPNLSVLMVAVPIEFQDLLVSVWEYCLNLEQLVLNLDEDQVRDESPSQDACMDSVFSGISETDCKRLGKLAEKDLETIDWNSLRSSPSVTNLKRLRHLYIFGPGYQLFKISGDRTDKFTNVFGYSTLVCLSTLTYLFVHRRLSEITPICAEFIRNRLNLTIHESGFHSDIEFIKTGCGYENEKGVPFNWARF